MKHFRFYNCGENKFDGVKLRRVFVNPATSLNMSLKPTVYVVVVGLGIWRKS